MTDTSKAAMKLALEALQEPLGFTGSREIDAKLREAITAIKQALAAPTVQPVDSKAKGAIMGAAYDFRDAHISGSMNLKRSAHAALENAVDAALNTPPAQPASVPTSWMDMVTANLVREGVNKHKARELAEHFYTTPPAAQPAVPLTDEKKYRLLEHGEKIEKGDTVMGDDTVTWYPLAGWEVGLQWGGHFMMPMRREKAAHGITKGQP
jgi:hypothetical protein